MIYAIGNDMQYKSIKINFFKIVYVRFENIFECKNMRAHC